jgi:ABC-type nickel/cobalt efflux system permease component RcnA
MRRSWLLSLILAMAWATPVAAHPVPRRSHDRIIDVSIRRTEVAIDFRIEVDEWTVVFVDLPALLEPADMKRLTKPNEFYETYVERIAPLLADQMYVTLNGQPLQLRCVDVRFQARDSLQCQFIFQADLTLALGRDHRLEVRDDTYPHEPGRVKLYLWEGEGVRLRERVAPSPSLQARAALDLKPGDDERLRNASATFEVDPTSGGRSTAQTAPSAAPEARSTLTALLDSPHGFGLLLLLAVGFGGAHALTPGHGKTLVAAYLVGERGTVWHAIVLGLVTTITHTGAVLLLAVGLVWLFPDAVPATIQTALGFIGGLLIAGLGFCLLLRRLAGQVDHVHIGGIGHTHNPDGTVSVTTAPGWWGLVLLGVSGGIIPCWDAIAMLGFAIAAQRLWLGLPLLIAFSAGLAGVLVAIGIVVVLAKNRLGRNWSDSRLWKALPILSAAVLVAMGLWLCRDSLLTPGPG